MIDYVRTPQVLAALLRYDEKPDHIRKNRTGLRAVVARLEQRAGFELDSLRARGQVWNYPIALIRERVASNLTFATSLEGIGGVAKEGTTNPQTGASGKLGLT